MSVFRCERCNCYGNTALGGFWWRLTMEKKKEKICHACLHEEFPDNKEYTEDFESYGRFDKCPDNFVDELI